MKTRVQAIECDGFAYFNRMADGIDVLSVEYDATACFGMFDRVVHRAKAALDGVPNAAVRPILSVADAVILAWVESGGRINNQGDEQVFTAELAKYINPLEMLGLIGESLRHAPVTLLADENGLSIEVEVTLERVCACLALTRAFEGARLLGDADKKAEAAYCLMVAATSVGLIEPVNNIAVGSLTAEIVARIRAKTAALGGQRKAANAAKRPPNPERTAALDLKAKRPELSAKQIKTRLGLRASERTISGWLAVC